MSSSLGATAGAVVHKDELLRAGWVDTVVEENNLNQNISILRRVLGDERGGQRYIATLPGRGYQFVARVRTGPAAPRALPDGPSILTVAVQRPPSAGPSSEQQ